MIRTISTNDTKKMIRKELKAAFPGTKFSVKQPRYSKWEIEVNWTNGPSVAQVKELVGYYNSGFNRDTYTEMPRTLNTGEVVQFSNRCIHFNRDYTVEVMQQVSCEVMKQYNFTSMPEIEWSKEIGAYMTSRGEYATKMCNKQSFDNYEWCARSIVQKELHNKSI